MLTCIVVPCYNEEKRLDKLAFQTFSKNNPNIHFLFVNDGSTDNTSAVITELANTNPTLFALSLEKNQGKAEAVRAGVLSLKEKSYQYTGYWDADLSIPLNEISDFTDIALKYPSIQLIMGIRLKRMGSNIERTLVRHFFSRIIATLISNTLGLPTYDTQCGAKIVNTKTAFNLFEASFSSSWFFDVELLARLIILNGKKQVMTQIFEQPLRECIHKDGSKISAISALKIPFELLKIKKRYKL